MFFSLLVLTIILGIVLGLSSMAISQIKMVRGMGYSVIAFHAANSGIERALRMRLHDGISSYTSLNDVIILLNGENATYRIEIIEGGDPGCLHRTHYCIRSIGKFKGVQRAIEVGN